MALIDSAILTLQLSTYPCQDLDYLQSSAASPYLTRREWCAPGSFEDASGEVGIVKIKRIEMSGLTGYT